MTGTLRFHAAGGWGSPERKADAVGSIPTFILGVGAVWPGFDSPDGTSGCRCDLMFESLAITG